MYQRWDGKTHQTFSVENVFGYPELVPGFICRKYCRFKRTRVVSTETISNIACDISRPDRIPHNIVYLAFP
jgi:hypothetical protein